MLILIPVSRFRVDYQLAFGRPYSEFERLVLQAISEGAGTVMELESIFCVHPRLVLEALVTLTQAGWLAVGGGGHSEFSLTAAGRAAAASGGQPRSRVIDSGYTWLVMERVTGALINNNEVRYLSAREITKFEDQALKMPERIFERRLNEAQVDQHIARAKGEWLHRVMAIDMRSRQAHWIPVTLDLDTRQFDDNLPARWKPRLGPIILEAALKSRQAIDSKLRGIVGPHFSIRKTKAEATEQQAISTKCPILLNSSDLIYNDSSHRNYLATVFGEAHSKILIASAFLRISCLEALRPAIFSALERGISVDFLWGYGPSGFSGPEAVEYLKRLVFDARKNNFVGQLRYNKLPSGSHAKLVVWDRGQTFEACLGSYNWLSAAPPPQSAIGSSEQSLNASVCLRHPAILSRLIRCAMAWWTDSQASSLDASPHRWRHLASLLEEKSFDLPPVEANSTAELIFDHDHEIILRDALTSAREKLIVASHKLGRIGETRLVAACDRGRANKFQFKILYGTAEVDEATLRDISVITKNAGGVVRHVENMHAKLIVADSAACIGSYNFLSADPFGTARNARELSVLLDGAAAADLVWESVKHLESSQH